MKLVIIQLVSIQLVIIQQRTQKTENPKTCIARAASSTDL
jgi:hypothetical protein